jgi:2,4-dienoyl-CoA reductase-like NADH-dependent reductase (Old Yellow Enzyme family)
MPLDETVATFSHFIKEVNALDLAYICLVRYAAMFDTEKRGTDHDVLATYKNLITSPTRHIPNCGFTPEEAAGLIEKGEIDAVEFGSLWISHPDLALRIQEGHPLDGKLDFMTLYGNGGSEEEQVAGYTDYPTWTEKA